MDVKGARALSERLAEAARNVDPPPAKAVDSGDTDRGSEVADTRTKTDGPWSVPGPASVANDMAPLPFRRSVDARVADRGWPAPIQRYR